MAAPAPVEKTYTTPADLSRMRIAGKFDINKMKKVMFGPRCFLCYVRAPFFTCNKCNQSYHRRCLQELEASGHPLSQFNAPLQVVNAAEYEQVQLLECSFCFVESETMLTELRSTKQEDLNTALYFMAKVFFDKNVREILSTGIVNKNNPGQFPVTLDTILCKTEQKEYKSIEGFMVDLRRIRYNIIYKHTEASEEDEAANLIIQSAFKELKTVIACLKCYVDRWDPQTFKIRSKTAHSKFNVQVCEKPHPLVWLKEPQYPYWPSKILSVEHNTLLLQCFNENGQVREIIYPSASRYDVKTFSSNPPEKKPKNSPGLDKAVKECREYLRNLRKRFGQDAVVVPTTAKDFDGNMDALFNAMFPQYDAGNSSGTPQ